MSDCKKQKLKNSSIEENIKKDIEDSNLHNTSNTSNAEYLDKERKRIINNYYLFGVIEDKEKLYNLVNYKEKNSIYNYIRNRRNSLSSCINKNSNYSNVYNERRINNSVMLNPNTSFHSSSINNKRRIHFALDNNSNCNNTTDIISKNNKNNNLRYSQFTNNSHKENDKNHSLKLNEMKADKHYNYESSSKIIDDNEEINKHKDNREYVVTDTSNINININSPSCNRNERQEQLMTQMFDSISKNKNETYDDIVDKSVVCLTEAIKDINRDDVNYIIRENEDQYLDDSKINMIINTQENNDTSINNLFSQRSCNTTNNKIIGVNNKICNFNNDIEDSNYCNNRYNNNNYTNRYRNSNFNSRSNNINVLDEEEEYNNNNNYYYYNNKKHYDSKKSNILKGGVVDLNQYRNNANSFNNNRPYFSLGKYNTHNDSDIHDNTNKIIYKKVKVKYDISKNKDNEIEYLNTFQTFKNNYNNYNNDMNKVMNKEITLNPSDYEEEDNINIQYVNLNGYIGDLDSNKNLLNNMNDSNLHIVKTPQLNNIPLESKINNFYGDCNNDVSAELSYCNNHFFKNRIAIVKSNSKRSRSSVFYEKYYEKVLFKPFEVKNTRRNNISGKSVFSIHSNSKVVVINDKNEDYKNDMERRSCSKDKEKDANNIDKMDINIINNNDSLLSNKSNKNNNNISRNIDLDNLDNDRNICEDINLLINQNNDNNIESRKIEINKKSGDKNSNTSNNNDNNDNNDMQENNDNGQLQSKCNVKFIIKEESLNDGKYKDKINKLNRLKQTLSSIDFNKISKKIITETNSNEITNRSNNNISNNSNKSPHFNKINSNDTELTNDTPFSFSNNNNTNYYYNDNNYNYNNYNNEVINSNTIPEKEYLTINNIPIYPNNYNNSINNGIKDSFKNNLNQIKKLNIKFKNSLSTINKLNMNNINNISSFDYNNNRNFNTNGYNNSLYSRNNYPNVLNGEDRFYNINNISYNYNKEELNNIKKEASKLIEEEILNNKSFNTNNINSNKPFTSKLLSDEEELRNNAFYLLYNNHYSSVSYNKNKIDLLNYDKINDNTNNLSALKEVLLLNDLEKNMKYNKIQEVQEKSDIRYNNKLKYDNSNDSSTNTNIRNYNRNKSLSLSRNNNSYQASITLTTDGNCNNGISEIVYPSFKYKESNCCDNSKNKRNEEINKQQLLEYLSMIKSKNNKINKINKKNKNIEYNVYDRYACNSGDKSERYNHKLITKSLSISLNKLNYNNLLDDYMNKYTNSNAYTNTNIRNNMDNINNIESNDVFPQNNIIINNSHSNDTSSNIIGNRKKADNYLKNYNMYKFVLDTNKTNCYDNNNNSNFNIDLYLKKSIKENNNNENKENNEDYDELLTEISKIKTKASSPNLFSNSKNNNNTNSTYKENQDKRITNIKKNSITDLSSVSNSNSINNNNNTSKTNNQSLFLKSNTNTTPKNTNNNKKAETVINNYISKNISQLYYNDHKVEFNEKQILRLNDLRTLQNEHLKQKKRLIRNAESIKKERIREIEIRRKEENFEYGIVKKNYLNLNTTKNNKNNNGDSSKYELFKRFHTNTSDK